MPDVSSYPGDAGGRNYSRIAVLSGPTFAKEVAAGEPAAVVIASEPMELAERDAAGLRDA